jgi:hypothetical protein
MHLRNGYSPRPERLREIAWTGSRFVAALFAFHPSLRRPSSTRPLPGFSEEDVKRAFVERLLVFERALNPARLALENALRREIRTEGWSDYVERERSRQGPVERVRGDGRDGRAA